MKLHELVAVRKGVKSRTYSQLTEAHNLCQRAEVFTGMEREYNPTDDDGERYPNESKMVQANAAAVIKGARSILSEAWNIEAAQELGNRAAKADIIVDGQTLATDVPATLLIYMEKQLQDLRKFAETIPSLDPAKSWRQDPNTLLYRTEPVQTRSTKKVQRPIVMYEATKEHPAQTQMITEDVTVGHWSTTYLCGGMPIPQREELIERIDKLRDAVKQARSRANDVEVQRPEFAAPVLDYIFK